MNVYTNPPIVSVIIPTFGHAEFILETINSVFGQTYQEYEIIIVNDGSPDNTAELLQPLIEKGLIRYIEQINSGVAVARNTGLAHSSGKYIAFLDDDDIWPADKLEWQVREIEKDVAVAIGGCAGFFELDKHFLGSPETAGITRVIEFKDLFSGNPFVSPGQVLIDRNALERIGGFDSNIWGADDFDLFMRLSKIGRVVKYSDISLYYRIHQTNASKNHVKMIINTEKVVCKHLSGLNWIKKLRFKTISYRWMFHYLGRLLILDIQQKLVAHPPQVGRAFREVSVFFGVFGCQMMLDPELFRTISMFVLRQLTRAMRQHLAFGSTTT